LYLRLSFSEQDHLAVHRGGRPRRDGEHGKDHPLEPLAPPLEAARRKAEQRLRAIAARLAARDEAAEERGSPPPRSNREKRREVEAAVRQMLEQGEHWSNREIARRCRVSPELVDRLRPQLEAQLVEQALADDSPPHAGSKPDQAPPRPAGNGHLPPVVCPAGPLPVLRAAPGWCRLPPPPLPPLRPRT